MEILLAIGIVALGYVLGSIPFGLLIVKLKTGKDIRKVESGRTGGTNAMRAAGFWAGLMTAIMDVLKGTVTVWIAQAVFPDNEILHVLAPDGSSVCEAEPAARPRWAAHLACGRLPFFSSFRSVRWFSFPSGLLP